MLKAAAGQLDAHDDGAVGNHHGHRAEVDLEVLRQLLTPRVPRVLNTCTTRIYTILQSAVERAVLTHRRVRCLARTMVRKSPNSGSRSTTSPSVKMNCDFRSFLHCSTMAICCAATDNTGSSIRLNSSKQPHDPDCARPVRHGVELLQPGGWSG